MSPWGKESQNNFILGFKDQLQNSACYSCYGTFLVSAFSCPPDMKSDYLGAKIIVGSEIQPCSCLFFPLKFFLVPYLEKAWSYPLLLVRLLTYPSAPGHAPQQQGDLQSLLIICYSQIHTEWFPSQWQERRRFQKPFLQIITISSNRDLIKHQTDISQPSQDYFVQNQKKK